MNRRLWAVLAAFLVLAGIRAAGRTAQQPTVVEFPGPRVRGGLSLNEALSRRRSSREFSPAKLTLPDLGQLLWAGQGITHGRGGRTSPSAGALYPLDIVVVAGGVEGLGPGVYRYLPMRHALAALLQGDRREALCSAALHQPWVKSAPVLLVFTAVPSRTTGKYGERGVRYLGIEAGCAAQNAMLEASALGLGSCAVGAFDDAAVARQLGLASGETPLLIVPVGRPSS
ncbi:MAG: SagB/ThcOx family dehydrogenase [Acidobacteriota bacterium]